MKTHLLQQLSAAGQAIWLDFVDRQFLADGGLRQLIQEDALTGVTSNPTIFEKAMGHGDAYDEGFKAFLAKSNPDVTVTDIYESQAIRDIQDAADDLRPTYERLGGCDGYVSLEVSPYFAQNTPGTVEEARRMWAAVNRPNLMVKVPATPSATAAIRQLIEDGLNINITLLFSKSSYQEVADAFMAGLEGRIEAGKPIDKVASVASFFVSRIDAQIDKLIDERVKNNDEMSDALKALRGKVAIANAKLAYVTYREMIASGRWQALAAHGAMPQRLLWASTGSNDPNYSPTIYIDALIGPDTVNTMPPKTMDAFREQGAVAETLTQDIESARFVLAETERLGLDLERITKDLVQDGVKQFADASDKLLAAVEKKRIEFRASTQT